MKRNRSLPTSLGSNRSFQFRGRRRGLKGRWILTFAGLSVLALGFGMWALAQPASSKGTAQAVPQAGSPEPPMTPQRELSLLAIQQPVEFEAEIRQHNTPAVILEEQKAIFAISQPKAYSAEFERFKDNARRDQESQARSAILKPVEFRAQHLTKRSRNQEQDEELAAWQMLNANSRRLPQPHRTAAQPAQP